MDPSGFGLALCLDDILGYDRERFTALESRFREFFPQVKSIKLIAEPAYRAPEDYSEQVPALQKADGKGIHFEFAGGGPLVRAQQASDGVLLVLAYLTVLHLPQPPRVILIEEPENGVHPRRLRDVLEILRELVGEQSRSQVILTTHSPYVVDLFRPEEVSLCQRELDGAVSVHRLSESSTVREQLNVFELGEIWTAEGDEALAQSTADGAGGTRE
jgi:predicted ATPase